MADREIMDLPADRSHPYGPDLADEAGISREKRRAVAAAAAATAISPAQPVSSLDTGVAAKNEAESPIHERIQSRSDGGGRGNLRRVRAVDIEEDLGVGSGVPAGARRFSEAHVLSRSDECPAGPTASTSGQKIDSAAGDRASRTGEDAPDGEFSSRRVSFGPAMESVPSGRRASLPASIQLGMGSTASTTSGAVLKSALRRPSEKPAPPLDLDVFREEGSLLPGKRKPPLNNVWASSMDESPTSPLAKNVEQRRAQFRRRQLSSAEERYGKPPKPYTNAPIVSVDRRLPAPTLRQQMQGTRRRPTGSTRTKTGVAGSTWQVADFVMQPTTIDFRGVYYSPEHRTLKSRVADAWRELRASRAERSLRRQISTTSQRSAFDVEAAATNPDYILKGITFRVNPGTLCAVMGPSGSGKTTLLDIVAKRYVGRIEGGVYFNGVRWTRSDVQNHVGYVLQNDSLLPSLTVEETLMFMGKLGLPPSITDAELYKKISGIIQELGLSNVAKSQVGDGETIRGLSGGERRRVSIGVQLLVAPGVILLDEPTTGLDSFNANQLLRTLTKLTHKQHLVMVSIHQPRSDLVRMFNTVVLLNGGEMVWAGPTQSMISYFDLIGYPCPQYANPLQYFLTLSSVSSLTDEDRQKTEDRVAALKTTFIESDYYKDMCEEIGWDASPLKRLRARQVSGKLDQAVAEEPFERPSIASKLLTLTRRALINTMRSRGAVFTRTLQLPLLALYLFLFFTRLGDDQQSVQNRVGLVLETLVEIALASTVTAISLCPPLQERYHRESLEGMYGAALFVLSYLLHSVPFSIGSSLLWTIILYFGAGMQLTPVSKVFIYWAVVFLLHLVGECIAIMMLGLSSSVPMADASATFLIMVGIAVGGGVYRVASTVPLWLDVLSYTTPFKYSGAILQVNEMRGLSLTCSQPSSNTSLNASVISAIDSTPACLWLNGSSYLDDSLLPWQQNIGTNFAALLAILLAYYVIAFIAFECRKKILH